MSHLSWISALPMLPLLAGNVLLARRNRWGWALTALGDVAFMVYGIATGQWGFVLDVVFLVIRIDGWRRWRKSTSGVYKPPAVV